MKRNDIKALHDKNLKELNALLIDLLNQLAKIRLEKSAGRLENTSSVKNLADDVARVRTVITQKEAEISSNPVEPKIEEVEKKEKSEKKK